MCPCLCPWTFIVLVRKSVYSIGTHYMPWDLHIQMRLYIWLFLWLTKTILGSWVYYVGSSHRTNQRKDMVNNFFRFLTYVLHIKSKLKDVLCSKWGFVRLHLRDRSHRDSWPCSSLVCVLSPWLRARPTETTAMRVTRVGWRRRWAMGYYDC